jgi:4-diphosphocytidyl-2-C-methyl-D-erythritol kinase
MNGVRGRDGAPGAQVRVRASGKLNLALGVGRRQPDGYHPLATVFQAVSAFEDVTATYAEGVSVTVSGLHADLVPLGEDNLAIKAARLLAEATGIEAAVHLHLHKGVPVGGGMAGGSADAAAALVACDALWGTELNRDQISELAALLGSDVPFAMHGHTAVGRGRGHLISPAMTRGSYHWALGLRRNGLSTPRVYAAFDALIGDAAPDEPHLDAELMRALRSGNAVALGAALSNDLQPAALELAPHLAETLALAEDAGALGVVVSGSGPTVAALAADGDQAVAIGSAMLAAGVVDDVLCVTGPVPGARVVHGIDQAPQADDEW